MPAALWARSLRLTLGMQLGSSAFGCQHGCQTPCVHNTDTRPRLLRAPEPSTGGHVRTHPTPAWNPPSTCPFAFLQMCSSSARELPVVQMFKLGTGGRRKRVIKTTLSKERPFTFPSKHVTPTWDSLTFLWSDNFRKFYPTVRGAWQATVHEVAGELDTT